MFNLTKIIRPNILTLEPYSSARDEFKGSEGIFLDANENPFGSLNRYPDPLQKSVKQKLSEVKNVPAENIFLGNGSDEIIDLCYRIFCEPGKDKALTFVPTYGMYEVSAAINNVELIKLPLNSDFQIDTKSCKTYLKDTDVKLIFICSPNNPTGNIINNIEYILENFNGVVVVDEAYIDFAGSNSLSAKLDNYPNLIVLQTLSKAWGLAAARMGIAFASTEIIIYLNKVKPPYNMSSPNQQAALNALDDLEIYQNQLATILSEKEKMLNAFADISIITKVYPTDANFILIKVKDADKAYNQLINKNIILRNRSKVVADCLRITIGTPQENEALLSAFKNIQL
ncbi:histidinol-phosphate transaminase [Flavobacterium sp. Sd200]|uniref:histidinol-phosphate transaminase n=1 Tax=Flavobacterium sp. Sd200 TaxID=2692211 RepID=UPI00192588BD|nr:histidinol-phosphate transaminase [Flavobacterium sp. Sd200]